MTVAMKPKSERLIRLSMLVDYDEHKQLKLEAVEQGGTLKEYVMGILSRRHELADEVIEETTEK